MRISFFPSSSIQSICNASPCSSNPCLSTATCTGYRTPHCPGIADWIMVELQIQCGCKNSMKCLFCVLSGGALLEGLDSNLMLYVHLQWRRHKFEFNSTLNPRERLENFARDLRICKPGANRSKETRATQKKEQTARKTPKSSPRDLTNRKPGANRSKGTREFRKKEQTDRKRLEKFENKEQTARKVSEQGANRPKDTRDFDRDPRFEIKVQTARKKRS